MEKNEHKKQIRKSKPSLERFKYEAAQEYGITYRGEQEEKEKYKK